MHKTATSYDFILGQWLNIRKMNVSDKFGENPTSWRHFMTLFVIFAICDVNVTSSRKNADVGEIMTSY